MGAVPAEGREAAAGRSVRRVRIGEPLWHRALEFYFLEAEFLDDNRFVDWLNLLDDDVTYAMPVRVTNLSRSIDTTLSRNNYFEETRRSLERRVRRLTDTETAWAEMPPSRTRRFISNLRLEADDEALRARTNLLLLRSRGDDPKFEFLSAERFDVLVERNGELVLKERRIVLDQSVLGNANLALFY